MKYPFKVGDLVTPVTEESSFYNQVGVVTECNGSYVKIRYRGQEYDQGYRKMDMRIADEYIVTQVLTKYQRGGA